MEDIKAWQWIQVNVAERLPSGSPFFLADEKSAFDSKISTYKIQKMNYKKIEEESKS
jgi:hypothetical protein